MTQLVVVAFDEFSDARDALLRLRDLERDGRLHLEDSALIEREEDGMAHVMDEVSGTTESAALIGPFLGGIVAYMFPLARVILGDAMGAAIGAALHAGEKGDFIDEVKRTLRPGRSALFLVAKQADADALTDALRGDGGDLVQTTLSPEVEEALRQALAHDIVPAG